MSKDKQIGDKGWAVIEKDFEALMKDLNKELGWFGDEALANTPKRITRFYKELKANEHFTFTTFDVPTQQTKGLIILKSVRFYSLCEHHMLPFEGVATIAYMPKEGGRICGVSKLARAVVKFASKPQLQERMTNEIADYLKEQLDAHFVMVVLRAVHFCLRMRGVKQPESEMVTSAVRANEAKMESVKDINALKQEVLDSVKLGHMISL
ncbi:MAG: GTP cyclohydrolase I FolE [Candidatus Micrarchaeota archaeon]|nr:GTP cyclohydrolase I FolE [Candidatus Micrarchaeota archaeon]